MRILVTGSTTQTGSLAVRALLREGHAVRCLVHSEKRRPFLPRGVEIVEGDLARPDTVAPALDAIERVVQIAHIRFAGASIPVYERAGIRRAIFLSSTRRFTQFDCVTARQVREGEAAVEASALDYTILRPSMIYGSARDNNIARLIRYLRRHRLFPLVGGGRNLVQPLFVLDLVAALLAALQRHEAIRRAYTLAGPEPIPYRQQIETIARTLGRSVVFVPFPLTPAVFLARCAERILPRSPLKAEMLLRLQEDRAFDIGPARQDLGFAPISFEEGVRREAEGEIDRVWV